MKLWLQNEFFTLKEWIPQRFEISCMNNFSVSHMLCACFTVCSRSELWQSKTDILQLWLNIDLILQNQHLKLLMLQGKWKEYSVKKSKSADRFSGVKTHTTKKAPKPPFSEYQKNWNSRLFDQTELKNWISCELLFNFCHSNGYRVSTGKKILGILQKWVDMKT